MEASEWDETYRAADRLWSVTPNLFVADRLATITPGRGLDLAAGEGRNAIWLAVAGLEDDWRSTSRRWLIESWRGRSDRVEFVVADVLEWEPEGLFDLILIAYLHLEPPDFEKVVHRAGNGWRRVASCS